MIRRAGIGAVVFAGMLAVLSAAASGAVSGNSAPKQGSSAGPSGATAMTASAAYPGLGQLLNGAEPKAAIISAVETFLVAGLIVEDRRARNSLRLYKQTSDERYYDEYSEHFDNRQTLVWWAVIAALYGLADAYVDAHLADFDDSTAPQVESSFGESGDGGGELRVGLTFKF
ncbi:MAG: DUF5683 domain-containing protein [Candidatus Eisenbacteria bacterium]|nr:DUF5683 domain-containing protein [Candidatus Eisenbacteria bacterium]